MNFKVNLVRRSDRGVTQLEHIVLDIETRVTVAAVDILKTIRFPLVSLHQKAKSGVSRVSVGGMQAVGCILTGFQHQIALKGAGNRSGNHVHRPTDGVGTLGNRSGSLQNFNRVHPACGWKVVCGWRRVGSRSDQCIVFKQGNTTASLRCHTPDADVGSKAISIFYLHRYARHLTENTLDVSVGELFQLILADILG